MKDTLFSHDTHKQFEFDERVVSVFDDMIERSIPHYREVLELIVDFCILNLNLESSSIVYDLGSSTGSTLLALSHRLNELNMPPMRLIGIDNSIAMVQKATLKAKAYEAEIEFVCDDLLQARLLPSRVVIANYILQFIRPMQRLTLLSKIYESLESGGVLFLGEKMISHDRVLDRQMIERYLRYKREQGYTQGEISKKREALENVLVPFSLDENIKMLRDVGFSGIEVIFKWVNFGTFMARKD